MGRFQFSDLDMKQKLDSETYHKRLESLHERLKKIQQAYLSTGESAVIVFEGWDAAGKGGAIRRITMALDPRGFKVWPISAPRDYFLERHYMARFWEKLPPKGSLAIFDRSWYGRVLVERVEELIDKKTVKNAYREINEFEQTLIDNGSRVIKFFLYIDQDEQLKRFKDRLLDPLKRWKLSYEDFRNRKRWDEYREAAEDMLALTSPKTAPWHVIPANNKKFARVEVISTLCEALEKNVDLSPPTIDEKILKEAGKQLDLDPADLKSMCRRTE